MRGSIGFGVPRSGFLFLPISERQFIAGKNYWEGNGGAERRES